MSYETMVKHAIKTFWADSGTNKGYGWFCECGAKSQVNFGTREAAFRAGENIHLARFQSEKEIRAKRQEEHNRIKARSQEILERFVGVGE